jgi:hypothetical protein
MEVRLAATTPTAGDDAVVRILTCCNVQSRQGRASRDIRVVGWDSDRGGPQPATDLVVLWQSYIPAFPLWSMLYAPIDQTSTRSWKRASLPLRR